MKIFKNTLFATISIKNVFARFAFVFIFAFLSMIFAVILNHKENDILEKVLYWSVLSMFLSTTISLFFEQRKFGKSAKLLTFLIPFAILGFGSFYLDMYFYTFAFLSVFLSLVFSKFLFRSSCNEAFLLFVGGGVRAFIFGFVVFVILSLAISLITFSIEYLFGVRTNSWISDLLIVANFVFVPFFILSNIPKVDDFNAKDLDCNRFSCTLVQNIFVPLLSVYALILYVYFAKITLFFELPKGGLSWMILSFSSLVIFVKILLLSVQNKHKLAKIFDKFSVYSLIVPLVFLAIAVFRRISDYGITEARFFLLFAFLWLGFVVVFLLLKRHFKYIFISLFVGFFALSLPFLDAGKIAVNSQMKRFQTMLKKNKILQDGKIIAQDLPQKARQDLEKLASYLFYRNAFGKKTLEQSLNKKIDSFFDLKNLLFANNVFELSGSSFSNQGVNVKGYDYFFKGVRWSNYNKNFSIFYANTSFVASIKDMTLKLSFENNQTIKFDIKRVIETLKEKGIKRITKSNIDLASIVAQNKDIKARVQIRYIKIKNGKIDTLTADVSIKQR